MAIDLTGISNENEFYTHHYLSAILENDLKSVFSTWQAQEAEKEIKPPYEKLKALAGRYFKSRSEMEKLQSPVDLLDTQHELFPMLLDALGYIFSPDKKELDNKLILPIIGEVKRSNGEPALWIIETVCPVNDAIDPLNLTLTEHQYDETEKEKMLLDDPLSEIITKQIFTQTEPPRWVILVSFSTVFLLDRSKWNEKRYLSFDLSEIFGRRSPTTLRAMAALLHKDSICPEDGIPLLDTLDENSHKHAFAVSEDLKYSAREAVELLGNEAIYYIRNVSKKGVFGEREAEKLDAQQLTQECLRYLYRLLFLFYIEARPELGFADMKSDSYRMGYSLESLRDIEMIPLTTEEARNGTFIHESLLTLFRLVFEGFNPEQLSLGSGKDTFKMLPLKSHLFDPDKTPLLNSVRFRNFVLQRIIELLSLSRPKGGFNRRGRISYAQLGINQLGAVYEGLLSYSGFFAYDDLYEVKKADAPYNELDTAFFVKAADLTKYEDNEKVFNDDGTLRMYPKGSFIYRLAGRSREKSASYYTPEVLTQCLVKYALKELLKDKTADDILKLTVCEPAMGNASFLNETINQMAEAYLQLKQKETGQIIGHDEYAKEKQKVKSYIADNNVYGVDLNPTAVELAEVSLWLNTIYEGAIVPWFGMQLVTGNSLIGARRQVFNAEMLETNRKGKETWLDVVPERVRLGELRPPYTVYHFLLPDKGMVDYNDKVIRSMAKNEIEKIKNWKKEFIKPFQNNEIETLKRLSNAIDKLWQKHIEQQRNVKKKTSDEYSVFGHEAKTNGNRRLTTQEKDKIFYQELLSENIPNSSPYRRLKLAMDYWCSLWFWPIEKADLLPTRRKYFDDLALILEGTVYSQFTDEEKQMIMFPEGISKAEQLKLVDEFGFVNVDKLCREIQRLGLVKELSNKYRFHHWELEFADLFADKGGFDLIIGNPPWIKIEWDEGGMMGDYEPLFVLQKYSSAKMTNLREETLQKYNIRTDYFQEYVEFAGIQNFLSALQNYPGLKGIKVNLYKCFLPQSWYVNNKAGITGFLHPEGIYDDPNGGVLRELLYPRLKYHFQFQNELKLFDIGNRNKFSINIYTYIPSNEFEMICNLFHPLTIDASFNNKGIGICGGIKNDQDNWNLIGHIDRIVMVNLSTLTLFSNLYDEPDTTPLQARLPIVHSQKLVDVLRKFTSVNRHLVDYKNEYFTTYMFDEAQAQKDGVIKRTTSFATTIDKWILSGPHISINTLLHQTPKRVCETHRAYDKIDLVEISDDYLPRTNYVPNKDLQAYSTRIPNIPWEKGSKVTNYYRFIARRQLSQSGERTLISAIAPKSVGHIHPVISLVFAENKQLVVFSGLCSSLILDFYLKTTGMNDLYETTLRRFPIIETNQLIVLRTMMLNSITIFYSDLWEKCWDNVFTKDQWTKRDNRLDNNKFVNLTSTWQRNCALRTDYERRQALVEIDVLTAIALGLTLDELCTIYRIQFPVLRQNENDTWHDQNGRIVFTCSKGLPGVGFSRPEWNEIKDMKSGTVSRSIIDDTMPGGQRERTITYVAPFDKCDREKDYEIAWKEFEKRLKGGI